MNIENISFAFLAYTDVEMLRNCFNDAFKVYYVPLQLTKEQFADKLFGEAIDMKLSFGAFDNEKLVGFILHGIDTIGEVKIAYNAGTGVLPEYRGRKLSFDLYKYAIEILKNNGVQKTVLEVIDENIPAIKTYEQMGFVSTKKTFSYKGMPGFKIEPSIIIKKEDQPNWSLTQMCEWKPSWQYSLNTLKRLWNNYTLFTATEKNIIKAYSIVNIITGRVAHFGSVGNETKYLNALFAHLNTIIENPLTIIFVDETATASNTFLIDGGLQKTITAYEMERGFQ